MSRRLRHKIACIALGLLFATAFSAALHDMLITSRLASGAAHHTHAAMPLAQPVAHEWGVTTTPHRTHATPTTHRIAAAPTNSARGTGLHVDFGVKTATSHTFVSGAATALPTTTRRTQQSPAYAQASFARVPSAHAPTQGTRLLGLAAVVSHNNSADVRPTSSIRTRGEFVDEGYDPTNPAIPTGGGGDDDGLIEEGVDPINPYIYLTPLDGSLVVLLLLLAAYGALLFCRKNIFLTQKSL